MTFTKPTRTSSPARRVVPLLVACLSMGVGSTAWAELCTIDAVPAATLLLPYFAVDLGSPSSSPAPQALVTMFLTTSGATFVLGTAVGGGTSAATQWVAESEGSNALCADTDGDGTTGLSGFSISFRDTLTGDQIVAFVLPADGRDLHEGGSHEVVVLWQGPGESDVQSLGVVKLAGDLQVESEPRRRLPESR